MQGLLPEDVDLVPEIIAMGTTRALRVKRIGLVFLLENLQLKRSTTKDGLELVEENWVVVAKAQDENPAKARKEIMEALSDTNLRVAAMMQGYNGGRRVWTPPTKI